MPVLTAGRVAAVLATGASARRDAGAPPRFKPGDPVAVRNLNPVGHTRIPRYIRGRRGIIECDYGIFVYPDDHALEQGEKPQHVYSVRFTAREVWGPDASPRDSLYIDLWDDYLDPA